MKIIWLPTFIFFHIFLILIQYFFTFLGFDLEKYMHALRKDDWTLHTCIMQDLSAKIKDTTCISDLISATHMPCYYWRLFEYIYIYICRCVYRWICTSCKHYSWQPHTNIPTLSHDASNAMVFILPWQQIEPPKHLPRIIYRRFSYCHPFRLVHLITSTRNCALW